MKKFILIILLLLPIMLNAYSLRYPDYVWDAYDFDGNTLSTVRAQYMATGYQPGNNVYITGYDGTPNSAIKMNASTLPLNPDVINVLANATQYSVQCHMQLAATTSFISPIGYGIGLPRGYELTTNNGDTWIFWYKTNNSSSIPRNGVGTNWFHLNIVWNNGILKLIQDGITTFTASTTNPINTNGFNFGGAITSSGAGAPAIDSLIISTQAIETEIVKKGVPGMIYYESKDMYNE